MIRKRNVAQEEAAPPLPDSLKDIAWVQDFLQVSRKRVFQLMQHEGLPHIKWDRTLRFHPHAIARWVNEHQQSA